jgi:lysophospholipase L1-like esterase
MATEVFRSSELAVRCAREFGSAACVVTFDGYTDSRNLDRAGFGEEFFRSRSIDAIHVISRENDWYQYAEMPAVAAAISDLTKPYQRVVAYGCSMGGYGAIRFGGMAGATVALAISPQFSIDPRAARFERRWKHDSDRIDFKFERVSTAPFVDTAYIAYDPNDTDRRHADLFRRRTRVIDVCLPDVGHPATGPIAQAGLLADLVLGVVADRVDIADVTRRVLETHEGSAHYHHVMSGRVRSRHARIRHAERAAILAPEHFGFLSHFASLLTTEGRFEEAQIAFSRAAALAPDHPVLLYKLTEFHERRGDIESAVAIAETLVERHSDTFRPRLERLRSRERRKRFGLGLRRSIVRQARRIAGSTLPVDVRVTCTPSPPPFIESWRLHEALIEQLPPGPVDVFLVGDSLAEYWPDELWAPLSLFNFGVRADKTQQAIWRLEQLPPASIDCRHAVIIIGANNLGAGDTADGIVAGIAAVAAAVVRVAPRARIHVVATPPCGEDLAFRSDVRREANATLARLQGFETINVDAALACGLAGQRASYQSDNIHLTVAGYAVLTERVRSRLSGLADCPADEGP